MFIPSLFDRINKSRDESEIVALWKRLEIRTVTELEPVLRAKVAKALISQGLLTLVKGKGLVYHAR